MNRVLNMFLIAVLALSVACTQQRAGDNRQEEQGASARQDQAMGGDQNRAAQSGDQAGGDRQMGQQAQGDMGNLSGANGEFAGKAAQGNIAEVQVAELGQQKLNDPQLKQLASQIQRDHMQANNQLQQIVRDNNGTMPTTLSEEHREHADRLSGMSGQEFDRQWLEHMVNDHQKDVEEYQSAANELDNQELKQYAQKTLPVIQKHLKMLQQAHSKMKQ